MSKSKEEYKVCHYCNQLIKDKAYCFPCGHSYCLHCLSLTLIHSKFAQINSKSITFFCLCNQKNGKYELSIGDYVKHAHESKEMKTCQIHKEKGIQYCPNCGSWLCERCLNNFHKGYKEHHVLNEKPEEKNKCILHDSEFVKYCNICQNGLCEKCLVNEDNEHLLHLEPIDEHMKKKSNELKRKFNIIKKEDLETILTNPHKNYLASISNEYNETKNKINNLISCLKDLLVQFENNYNKNVEFANNIVKVIKFSYKNFFKDINSIYTPVEIFNKLTTLNSEIKSVEFKEKKQIIFEKTLFKLQALKKEKLNKIKINCSDLNNKSEEENILIFPSGHEEFLSAFTKYSDTVILSGSLDTNVHIYNFNKAENTLTLKKKLDGEHTGSIQCICPFDNGLIATGSSDATIKIWNINTFSCEDTLVDPDTERKKAIKALLYVPTLASCTYNKLLSCDSGGKILLWNLVTKECEKEILENDCPCFNCINHLLDYNIFYACDKEGKCYIYDNKLDHVKTLKADNGFSCEIFCCLTISQENDIFIAFGRQDGNISIRNPEDTTEEFKEIAVLTGHTNWVTALVQKGKSNILLSGSRDETVKIWDLKKFTLIHEVKGFENTIIGIVISDDRYVLTGGAEGLIKSWKLK